MFLHLSVIHSVQGKGCRPWDGERAPSWGGGGWEVAVLRGLHEGGGCGRGAVKEPPLVDKRAVRILLECFLVSM